MSASVRFIAQTILARWSCQRWKAAEIPSGITRMMTSADISQEGPEPETDRCLHDRQQHAGAQGPGNDVGCASDDDGDEGRRHKLLAHERGNRKSGSQKRAAEPGKSRAEAERQEVHDVRSHAERARHVGFLHGRARLKADGRPAIEEGQRNQKDDRDEDERQPIGRKRILAHCDGPARNRDRRHERAKQHERSLAQDQADAPRHHEGSQPLPIKSTDDEPLQHRAHEGDGYECRDDG
jgi:hypothetical protein